MHGREKQNFKNISCQEGRLFTAPTSDINSLEQFALSQYKKCSPTPISMLGTVNINRNDVL